MEGRQEITGEVNADYLIILSSKLRMVGHLIRKPVLD